MTISGRSCRCFPKLFRNPFFILLRVVCPVEVLFLAKLSLSCKWLGQDDGCLWLCTLSKYGNILTFGYDVCKFSDFLSLPGKEGKLVFIFKFNVRCYHQFVTAVQCRHLLGSPKYIILGRQPLFKVRMYLWPSQSESDSLGFLHIFSITTYSHVTFCEGFSLWQLEIFDSCT